MTKPKITTNPVANQYAGKNERIIEYSNGLAVGGLISLRNLEDGTMRVELYRHDEEVRIVGGSTPRVEILHTRDSDGGCDLDVYLDGVKVTVEVIDVDPGRGYTAEDWQENIEYTRNRTDLSPAFKDAAVGTLEANSGNKYIR